MQTNLFDQLDLNIVSLPQSYWWQHPILQGVLIFFSVVLVVGIIYLQRFRRKKMPNSPVQQLVNVLYESAQQVSQVAVLDSQPLLVISVVLKRYTAWVLRDEAISGMTDQEWLLRVHQAPEFGPVIADCDELATLLDHYKFSGMIPDKQAFYLLFDKIYTIIAKTSSGGLPVYTGGFVPPAKQDKT